VQGLSDEILSPGEKEVFKTFVEIDQKEIIRQAADRQPYVDQGQSLNIKVRPEVTLAENVELIRLMWSSGLKSAYYHKGLNKAQELARANAACSACEA
jgi:ribonucleoside-diphosphate reductase alpha chain